MMCRLCPCCLCAQSIQGPRDEILVAFFSKDLKTASPEEKDLVAAVAAQDADAVQEALQHVSAQLNQLPQCCAYVAS